MKILLKLDSVHYTHEQNQSLYNDMIELEWDLPFLPRIGEFFDCDSIVENMPEFDPGLSWAVESVTYEKINGRIVPIIWLRGE